MDRQLQPVIRARWGPAPAGIDALLRQWEPLARSLARRFADTTEYEDLEQVARCALWQAAQRFDTTRGCQFYTFALPTILGALRRHVRDHSLSMRVPRRWWDLRPRLLWTHDALAQALGREPSAAELAARLGVSEEDVTGALGVQTLQHPLPLNKANGEADEDNTHAAARRIGASDPLFEDAERRLTVRQAIESLPSDLRDILDRRYFQYVTLHEIARQLGLSPRQTMRLERRALARLRHELREAFEPGVRAPAPILKTRSRAAGP